MKQFKGYMAMTAVLGLLIGGTLFVVSHTTAVPTAEAATITHTTQEAECSTIQTTESVTLMPISNEPTRTDAVIETQQSEAEVTKGAKEIPTPEATQTLISLGSFECTAYCSCSYCCGEGGGHTTASGTTPTVGRTIAVDSSIIPLGTTVVINGHEYVAEDTGSAVRGNVIDIYFDSHESALQWGRQTLEVYIYSEVN